MTSPKDTLENRLPEYVDSPGVLGKVVLFYINSTAALLLVEWLRETMTSGQGGQASGDVSKFAMPLGAGVLAVGVFCILYLLMTVLAFCIINMFMGSDNFVGDFLCLLARFAFVWGATQLVALPLLLIGALMGSSGTGLVLAVNIFLSLWQWILNMLVLVVTYDYNWWTALIILRVANCLIGSIVGALVFAGSQ